MRILGRSTVGLRRRGPLKSLRHLSFFPNGSLGAPSQTGPYSIFVPLYSAANVDIICDLNEDHPTWNSSKENQPGKS
jgi:hypothetical protein